MLLGPLRPKLIAMHIVVDLIRPPLDQTTIGREGKVFRFRPARYCLRSGF